jgi:acetoin utilization deacetylase AcuC-like enzyme
MLLYDSLLEMNMPDYGIGIPMDRTRSRTILKALEERNALIPVRTLREAAVRCGLEEPLISRADLERVHEPGYIGRLYNDPPHTRGREEILIDTYQLIKADGTYYRYDPAKAIKPLTALFDTLLHRVSGSYLACRVALGRNGEGPYDDFCFYFGGGMHHARYDRGSGFCCLNDPIIAIRKLQAEGAVSLVWIIDVDAHKGDGSAELVRFSRQRGETFRGSGPEIITLSAHMAAGWPLDAESLAEAEPGRAPLVESDIDIPVASGEESRYCDLLAEGFGELERLSAGRRPDLVLVVDGVDVYEKDGLPSTQPIKLSLDQCLERDRMILSFIRKQGIPSAWLMAGGYGPHAWEPNANFLQSLKTNPL